MTKDKALFICFCMISFIASRSGAQTLPVGLLENVEDAYRRRQLLTRDTSGVSYLVRPVSLADSLSAKDKLRVMPLPVVLRQQLNTHHPYGMNDGSMIPARGYQVQFSAGVFAKAGPLSIQFRPEFVAAQNSDYRQLYENGRGTTYELLYADYSNSIDQPSRFGNGAYTKAFLGQSSIRMTLDPVSVGLSNENLWWGPGRRNALLMSNNAPGFLHITLNTSRPVKTGIGSFEGQIIAGRIEGSGVEKYPGEYFVDKPDDWRYINAMVLTYQPKWVPGLFVGFDRSFVVYRKDMGRGFGDYLPVFSSATKQKYGNVDTLGYDDEDRRNRDQYFSGFVRWVLPESKTELYVQYGKNDFPWNIRDALVEPEHSRAYVIGFNKLVGLAKPDTYIEFGLELTHMEGANTGLVREQPIWYRHRLVPAGYTNRGQVLGAGIGPSANLQTFEASWVNGLRRIGLRVEYLTNNVNLAKFGKPWWDLSFAGKFDWNWKDLVFNAQLAYTRSVNYQYIAGQSANNLLLQLGILYGFK